MVGKKGKNTSGRGERALKVKVKTAKGRKLSSTLWLQRQLNDPYDLQEVEPIPGADIHVLDFMDMGADDRVKEWLGGTADVVMSDMAAASSGHKGTDHLRIMALCEAAAQLAMEVLEPGGTFVAKVLAGGAETQLLNDLKKAFTKTTHFKPPASRSDSSEKFIVATGFRGL